MVEIRFTEKRTLEDALDMHSGYVLDFSDRTFAEFFEDELGITIYQEKYSFNGSSKAKYMRAFIKVEDGHTVARVLRRLWEYRETVPQYQRAENREATKTRLFELLSRIEGSAEIPRTDAIDRFSRDETLDELVAAIERDISANRPGAALDRLHTYCMKKFGHLLDQRSVTWDRAEPLHSRVGKYVRALSEERELLEVTKQVIKSSISIFEKFNYIRNNRSLAHDNELLDPAEARFIYDAVTALLRFVKSLEAGRFEVSAG